MTLESGDDAGEPGMTPESGGDVDSGDDTGERGMTGSQMKLSGAGNAYRALRYQSLLQ